MKEIIIKPTKKVIEFHCKCGCVFNSDEYSHSDEAVYWSDDIYRLNPKLKIWDICPNCGNYVIVLKQYKRKNFYQS